MRTSLKLRLGKAFTLIELLIVITIIGILAVALVPRISQGPARARDVTRKADLQNISNALELYFADTNSYPDDILVGTIGSYMSGTVPVDPSTDAAYTYTPLPSSASSGSYTSYIVAALLETDTATGDNISACTSAPIAFDTSGAVTCTAGEETYYYLSQ